MKKRALALFTFENGKVAVYDFDSEQYHSTIRGNMLKVQGQRGEIQGRRGEVRELQGEVQGCCGEVHEVHDVIKGCSGEVHESQSVGKELQGEILGDTVRYLDEANEPHPPRAFRGREQSRSSGVGQSQYARCSRDCQNYV